MFIKLNHFINDSKGVCEMNFRALKKEIEADEGIRHKPYRCSAGKLTIGIGRNLDDRGLNTEEIDLLFYNDFEDVVTNLRRIFKDFDTFNKDLQHVLFNMCFQLGYVGFSKFYNFIAAIKAKQYGAAAHEMKNSLWYKQTTKRAERLIARVNKLV